MSRRIALAAGPMVFALAAVSAQQPVFRSGIDVVLVDVAVERGRNPVTGLTARDFILRDNDIVQQIDDVSIGTVPLDVSLLVATGGSTARDLDAFKSSIDRMRTLLRPDDRVRIIGFGTIVRTLVPLQPADAPLSLDALRVTPSGVMTPLFDALFHALAWPVPSDRRHLIVVFSDGFDTWSILGADRIGPIAERADGVLHVVVSATPAQLVPENPTVDVRTPSGTTIRSRESSARLQAQNDRWRASQSAVFDAAHRTGGAIHRLSDHVAAFEQILDTFRSSYVLRYTPRGVDRDGWHVLDVSIARPGTFTVRARRGYQAGQH